MNEEEMISLLKQAKPIFELAGKYGASKLDENLQNDQNNLIEKIQWYWLAGWRGTEIEELCQKAGYNSWQIRQVSLYLWIKMTLENQDKIEARDYRIYLIFAILTIIGASIIALIINSIEPASAGVRASRTGWYLYFGIGLILCSPVIGIGFGIRWLVKKNQLSHFNTKIEGTWPKGLYPNNEEGDTYFEK